MIDCFALQNTFKYFGCLPTHYLLDFHDCFVGLEYVNAMRKPGPLTHGPGFDTQVRQSSIENVLVAVSEFGSVPGWWQ